jgi:hypothetical protein
MKNIDIPNPVSYYSPYGYIQVDKTEYSDTDKSMIAFTKKNQNITGRLKVK